VENGEEVPMSMRQYLEVEKDAVGNENGTEKKKGKESQSQGSSLGFPVVKHSSTAISNAANGKKPVPHKKTSKEPSSRPKHVYVKGSYAQPGGQGGHPQASILKTSTQTYDRRPKRFAHSQTHNRCS
jgi:hypothetical protein